MESPYVTVAELSVLIRMSQRHIREALNGHYFIEGEHFVRPFGGKKILYVRAVIERDLQRLVYKGSSSIPMAGGRIAHV